MHLAMLSNYTEIITEHHDSVNRKCTGKYNKIDSNLTTESFTRTIRRNFITMSIDLFSETLIW